MSSSESAAPGVAAEELLAELVRRGFAEAEVYEKRGRSRGYQRALDREATTVATEAGWSARAGDARRSIFVAATGAPSSAVALPDSSPHALLLPEGPSGPRVVPWEEPEDLLAPLATEHEANALFEGLERALAAEIRGARLVAVTLSDGASEAAIVSTRRVRATTRSRAAWLRIEAEASGRRLLFSAGEREARRFRPEAIARRLVDRFTALAPGDPSDHAHPPPAFVLSAPLMARLVEALSLLFLGRAAEALLAAHLEADRRLAANAVTLVDDGRFAGTGAAGAGLLSAAADGEGVPTRAVELVAAGRFVQPLCAWWEEAPHGAATSSGCSRRASWRDLPRRAPTHFYLAPGAASVNELVGEVADGVYLLEAEGAVELDPRTLAFAVPVSGFLLSAGRAVAPLGPRRLHGTVASLLRGVRAVARDLTFVPGDGQFGAPTVHATGLELSGGGGLSPTPIR